MNSLSNSSRKNATIASIICGVLFATFSFTYLYIMQGEVLRTIHGILSEGKTSYSSIWGAAIITIILWLLQFGLNFLTHFRKKWQAISFLPVFLILVILTNIYPESNQDTFSIHYNWTWWYIVVIIVYTIIAFIYKKFPSTEKGKEKLPEILIPNLLVLTIFSCITGTLGNTNDNFHYELSVAQAIRENNFVKAQNIGKEALHSSHTLTTLRNFALSQTDSLGQALFTYPQSNGAGGLFFNEENGAVSSYTNQDIYNYLGGTVRRNNETIIHYLYRLCEQNEGNHKVLDYYLCSLLLERQLDTFVKALKTFYDEDGSLPRHYQEALILYREKNSEDLTFENKYDQVNLKKFKLFRSLQQEYPEAEVQRNYTRRKYGDTYWWYYWYAE